MLELSKIGTRVSIHEKGMRADIVNVLEPLEHDIEPCVRSEPWSKSSEAIKLT